MLTRTPLSAAVKGLVSTVLPPELDQLRCLVTASLLLQHSLATWCAQHQPHDAASGSNDVGAGLENYAVPSKRSAGCCSNAAAGGQDSNSQAAAGVQLLQVEDTLTAPASQHSTTKVFTVMDAAPDANTPAILGATYFFHSNSTLAGGGSSSAGDMCCSLRYYRPQKEPSATKVSACATFLSNRRYRTGSSSSSSASRRQLLQRELDKQQQAAEAQQRKERLKQQIANLTQNSNAHWQQQKEQAVQVQELQTEQVQHSQQQQPIQAETAAGQRAQQLLQEQLVKQQEPETQLSQAPLQEQQWQQDVLLQAEQPGAILQEKKEKKKQQSLKQQQGSSASTQALSHLDRLALLRKDQQQWQQSGSIAAAVARKVAEQQAAQSVAEAAAAEADQSSGSAALDGTHARKSATASTRHRMRAVQFPAVSAVQSGSTVLPAVLQVLLQHEPLQQSSSTSSTVSQCASISADSTDVQGNTAAAAEEALACVTAWWEDDESDESNMDKSKLDYSDDEETGLFNMWDNDIEIESSSCSGECGGTSSSSCSSSSSSSNSSEMLQADLTPVVALDAGSAAVLGIPAAAAAGDEDEDDIRAAVDIAADDEEASKDISAAAAAADGQSCSAAAQGAAAAAAAAAAAQEQELEWMEVLATAEQLTAAQAVAGVAAAAAADANQFHCTTTAAGTQEPQQSKADSAAQWCDTADSAESAADVDTHLSHQDVDSTLAGIQLSMVDTHSPGSPYYYPAAIEAERLQWPDGLALMTAIQYGMVHLQDPAVAAADDNNQQPFSWMYADPDSSSSSGCVASSSSRGIGWVLQQIAAQQDWRFECSSSSSAPTALPDLLTWQQQRQQWVQLLDKQRDLMQGKVTVQPEVKVGLSSFFLGELLQPSPEMQRRTAMLETEQQLLALAPAMQQHQQQQHLLCQPATSHHSRYTPAELDLLSKVAKIARGTELEAAIWSQVMDQPTVLTDGALLWSSGSNRMPISLPYQLRYQDWQQQQQQRVQPPVADHSKLDRSLSEQQQVSPTLGWFAPLLFAAFSALGSPGSLVMSPAAGHASLTAQPPLKNTLAAAIAEPAVQQEAEDWIHSEAQSKLQSKGAAAAAAAVAAAAQQRSSVLHDLQALGVLQHNDSRPWHMQQQWEEEDLLLLLQPQEPQWWQQQQQTDLDQQQLQLQDWFHSQQRLGFWQQQHQQSTSLAGVASGDACSVDSDMFYCIGQQAASQSLLQVIVEYPHYIGGNAELAAAVVTQAGRVWTTPHAVRQKLPQVQHFLQQQQQQQMLQGAAGSSTKTDASVLGILGMNYSAILGSTPSTGAAAAAAVADAVAAAGASSTSSSLTLSAEAELAASKQLFSKLVELLTQPKAEAVNVAAHWPHLSSSSSSSGVCRTQQQQRQQQAVATSLADIFNWAVALPDIVAASPDSLAQLMTHLKSPAVLQQLTVPALLNVYSSLMNWQRLSQWPHQLQYNAADLYSAVVAQLTVQAVGAVQAVQVGNAFAGMEHVLLEMVPLACTAAADVAPVGGWQLQLVGGQLRSDVQQLARSGFFAANNILQITKLCESAKAVHPLYKAVQQAALQGHLQLIAGALGPLLQNPSSTTYELKPSSVALLLRSLAAAHTYCGFGSFRQAVQATEGVDDGDPKGMWQGHLALAELTRSIVKFLTHTNRPQQQQSVIVLPSAVSPMQQPQQWWLWQQQQQQQPHLVEPPLPPLSAVAPSQIVKALKAVETISGSKSDVFGNLANGLMTAKVTAPSSSSSSSSSDGLQQQQQPLLHSWQMPQLCSLLLTLIPDARTKLSMHASPFQQLVFDRITTAATYQVNVITQMMRNSSSGSSSSSDRYRRGRHRPPLLSHASSSSSSNDLVMQLDSAGDITHACKQWRQYHPRLLDALGDLLTAARVYEGTVLGPKTLVMIASGMATFNYCGPAAAAAIRDWTSELLQRCHLHACTQLAWTLAVMNQQDEQQWKMISRTLLHIIRHDWEEYKRKQQHWQQQKRQHELHAQQQQQQQQGSETKPAAQTFPPLWPNGLASRLYQVHKFLEYCVEGVEPLLPPELERVAATAWAQNEVYVSGVQRQVMQAVSRLQARPTSKVRIYRIEHKTELRSSVDLLVGVELENGQLARLVIEVDGPTHFASNVPDKMLGPSELRDRLLRAQGYKVFSLPTFEWEKLEKNPEDGTLSTAGLMVFEAMLLKALEHD